VDVIGAVQQPGVYYLEGKPRVVDAVQAAGGLAPDAARDEINLAAAVVDGTQIRVPHVGEVPAEVSAASDTTASGMVNINNADVAALDSLPGIGPTTAQAVIEQRTKDGPFAKIEDIQNVKGIGPSLFAQIKTRITVGP
jgi:competence protein ComEA